MKWRRIIKKENQKRRIWREHPLILYPAMREDDEEIGDEHLFDPTKEEDSSPGINHANRSTRINVPIRVLWLFLLNEGVRSI